MDEEEAPAAPAMMDGEMKDVPTAEGGEEEVLVTTVTTLTTEEEELGPEQKTEEEKEEEMEEAETEAETEEEEEEEVEEQQSKGKKLLGSWEAEASSDARPPLPDPAFNRRCSLLSSDVKYKEAFEKMKGQSLFVPGAELIHAKNISAVISESKYKEEGKKEASVSLYSILPETPATQHAREASELQSEIKYKGNTKAEISSSLYSLLPETTETQFVKELTEILSENKYKEEGKKELSSALYSQLPETAEMQLAKTVAEFQSEVPIRTGIQPFWFHCRYDLSVRFPKRQRDEPDSIRQHRDSVV